MKVTPEAAAAAAADDMPPVLIVGSGMGHRRAAAADDGVARFLAAATADGRTVVFDRVATDPGALDDARSMSGFNTAALLGRRQVCALRRVDELPPEDVALLKRLVASSSQWWVMSAGSTGGLRDLVGFFLHVRAGAAPDEAGAPPCDAFRMLCVRDVPRIAKLADVSPAVASGATLAELSEAFRRFAFRRLPVHDAVRLAARLDTDVRTNRRPLMLSALIEDAVREADETARARAAARS